MGSTLKALLLRTKVWWLSRGKAFAKLFELWTELATFPWNNILLKEVTGKLWLFRLVYSARSILKMNKMNLSLQGLQQITFVAKDKIQAFKWKLEVWNTCIHLHHHELDSFPVILNAFSEMSGDN